MKPTLPLFNARPVPAAELPELTDKEELQSVVDVMHKLLTRGDLEYAHERLFAKSLKQIAEIVKEKL